MPLVQAMKGLWAKVAKHSSWARRDQNNTSVEMVGGLGRSGNSAMGRCRWAGTPPCMLLCKLPSINIRFTGVIKSNYPPLNHRRFHRLSPASPVFRRHGFGLDFISLRDRSAQSAPWFFYHLYLQCLTLCKSLDYLTAQPRQ